MIPSAGGRILRLLTVIGVLVAALSGCQGPPPPLYSSLEEAKTFGYADTQVETARYEVTYLTRPQRVSFTALGREAEIRSMSRTAEEIAELRAAEIALEGGYPFFRIVDRRTDSEVLVRDYAYFGAGGLSAFHRPRFSYLYGYPYAPAYVGSSAFAQARATLEVTMLEAKSEDSIEAKTVHRRLGTKYFSPPPPKIDRPPG